ncbi:alpha-1,4-glucan--maltose-1-phosphate maltosyltransferase [Caldimonas thermodepolymerans]|uniref:alpha-1,4-glucan--maltose-1-phosphate maltosyltransferase n=1 Tax=Caldimonas thermodepolymerans TaxID=215580 RepID=UPI002236B132|nr:alpha-1,4-glucan--maltose-1-phosphate maltosyltransferase [Caldimonas thermodepolymerans]UZG42700.1 alpha-1,4-glucan--maltose-1-phosphate maltosyltransferase [Caldimonas thermodepolymerans]
MAEARRRPARKGAVPDGRVRAVIDAVHPCVDGGRFAVKRIAGEPVQVEAHVFADGHDMLRVLLLWRAEADAGWQEVEMQQRYNDEWLAGFTPLAPGRYRYTVTAWVDHFRSWRHELERRTDPEDIRVAALAGGVLLEEAAARAGGADRSRLKDWARRLRGAAAGPGAATDTQALKTLALDAELAELADRHPDRKFAAIHPVELPLVADRQRARFSTWYELFPRSAAPEPGRHGSLRDVEARLPYVAELGFDVLYLPPIHPIGRTRRKGRNNTLTAAPDDVGSPWAIGAKEGGHKAVHPELGTLEDFRHLVERARDHGIEIALDIAFQCAPDHPYVQEHPEWFRWRPDGTVQYAENPPKKYQDIYPFNFESSDWQALWEELKSIFDHWIAQGVKIFRVDNPHTKSFAFWAWCIDALQREHPDLIFLSEAFTRPKVMHRLAKLGYTQSYTYFTWRNTRQELTEYFTELSQGPGREYFRPNVWPNTPDILHEALQSGLRSAFMARLVLAATLSASYGIYGPAYELMEHAPLKRGSEEYLDSEKYQLRHWDLDRADSLRHFVARINRIRRDNPALQSNDSLRFFPTDNEQLIAYAKRSADGDNVILTVVNLDPHHVQSGWLDLEAEALGIDAGQPCQVHDLLTDQRFVWNGTRNFILLDPSQVPAHVFRLQHRVRSEQDFDGFD